MVALVVVDFTELQDLHGILTGGHGQHVTAVVTVVQVIVRVRHRLHTALHAGRVTPSHEECSASIASGLSMKQHLGGASVDHRRGPDGHDSGFGVELSVSQHRLMLLNAHIQRHVVTLGPATQGRQPQNGVVEATLQQHLAPSAHQIGVTGMGGVTCLEGEHGVRLLVLELLHDLRRSEPPLIQTVIVTNALHQLDLSANEPVSSAVNVLDVRVAVVDHTVQAAHDLFFAIGVYLRVTQHSQEVTVLAHQSHRSHSIGACLAVNLVFDGFLGVLSARQHDGHRHRHSLRGHAVKVLHVGLLAVELFGAREVMRIHQNRVEVDSLQ
mmetsp:Transcript_24668/g.41704  ORF Transcript_24668/g.41704 Transcript_24668/m.41704 type:complete len:325 (+) Transcript_24668:1935-2909(+)